MQTVEADFVAQVRLARRSPILFIAASVQASQRNLLHTVLV